MIPRAAARLVQSFRYSSDVRGCSSGNHVHRELVQASLTNTTRERKALLRNREKSGLPAALRSWHLHSRVTQSCAGENVPASAHLLPPHGGDGLQGKRAEVPSHAHTSTHRRRAHVHAPPLQRVRLHRARLGFSGGHVARHLRERLPTSDSCHICIGTDGRPRASEITDRNCVPPSFMSPFPFSQRSHC